MRHVFVAVRELGYFLVSSSTVVILFLCQLSAFRTATLWSQISYDAGLQQRSALPSPCRRPAAERPLRTRPSPSPTPRISARIPAEHSGTRWGRSKVTVVMAISAITGKDECPSMLFQSGWFGDRFYHELQLPQDLWKLENVNSSK